jgi:hypothetical protein
MVTMLCLQPYGTSSDDSSQDGSIAFSPLSSARSPRRAVGLQHTSAAATRRLNSAATSSRSSGMSSSDRDYTSSSEQSCDTVIYVGKNGRVLSDRELTDNEGPPKQSSPVTVKAAATSSSGAAKTSQSATGAATRGAVSQINGVAGGEKCDLLEGADRSKQSSTATSAAQAHRKSPARANRTGTDVTEQPSEQCQTSTPLSLPQESVDVSSQKPSHQRRTAVDEQQHTTAVAGSTETSCQPVTPSSGKIRRKVRRPPLPSTDGGVDGELWIDGPNAEPFLQHHHQQQQQQHATAFVNGTVDTAATSAAGDIRQNEDNERWIDGPPEFRTELQSSPSVGRGLQGKPAGGGRMPKFAIKSTPHRRKMANDGGGTEIDGVIVTSQAATADEDTFEREVVPTAANIPKSRVEKSSDLASAATANRASAQQQQPIGNCDPSMETSGSPGTPSHKRRGHPQHHHSSKKGPLTGGISVDRDAQYADVPVTSPGRCRGAVVSGSQGAACPLPVNSSSSSSPRHAGSGGHGGRIAQWIRSVQAATAAAVFPSSPSAALTYRDPLQFNGVAAVDSTMQPIVDPRLNSWSSASPSRHHRDLPFRLRSADRAFRDPFGFLMDSFDSESDATLSIGNNSPPPDYASCVAGDRRFSSSPSAHLLDINENEANGNGVVGSVEHHVKTAAGLGTRSFEWPVSAAAAPVDPRRLQRTSGLWTYVPSPLLVNSSSSSGPYTCLPPGDCASMQSTTMTMAGAPEIYDVSTWPRRHQNATDVDAAQSKRLYHPDGASDPKLSVVEVARPPDPESLKVLSSIGLIPPPQLASIAPCLMQSFDSSPFCRLPFDTQTPMKFKSTESGSVRHLAADSSLHRLADGELYRSPSVSHDARMMRAASADDAEVASGRSVNTELSCTTPSTVVQRPIQPPTVQSPTSAGHSPPAAVSGSGQQAKTKTSTPASSRAAERCRSSSGVSLLSCISPRRRPRPFAGLFSRNHGSKDRPMDDVANGDVTCGESAAGSSDTGVTSGGDDASCEPGTSCCLQDSDRGSSLSDCTVPPPLPLPPASDHPVSGQEHEYDASSDYGSAQVDGEPSFAVSLSEKCAEADGRGTFFRFRSFIKLSRRCDKN